MPSKTKPLSDRQLVAHEATRDLAAELLESPDGLDLALGDATARVTFPERIEEPGRLRLVLKQLADTAREQAAS